MIFSIIVSALDSHLYFFPHRHLNWVWGVIIRFCQRWIFAIYPYFLRVSLFVGGVLFICSGMHGRYFGLRVLVKAYLFILARFCIFISSYVLLFRCHSYSYYINAGSKLDWMVVFGRTCIIILQQGATGMGEYLRERVLIRVVMTLLFLSSIFIFISLFHYYSSRRMELREIVRGGYLLVFV